MSPSKPRDANIGVNSAAILDTASRDYFTALLTEDADKSPAVACIETLMHVLRETKGEQDELCSHLQIAATTVIGLNAQLHDAIGAISTTDYSCTTVRSAGELFIRFISLAPLDEHFSQCLGMLVLRGRQFIERVTSSRDTIVRLAQPFITDESVSDQFCRPM